MYILEAMTKLYEPLQHFLFAQGTIIRFAGVEVLFKLPIFRVLHHDAHILIEWVKEALVIPYNVLMTQTLHNLYFLENGCAVLLRQLQFLRIMGLGTFIT